MTRMHDVEIKMAARRRRHSRCEAPSRGRRRPRGGFVAAKHPGANLIVATTAAATTAAAANVRAAAETRARRRAARSNLSAFL